MTSHQHDMPHEKSLNNETPVGPSPQVPISHNHCDLPDKTMHSSVNPTASTPRTASGGPLENDFSPNSNGSQYSPYHMHIDANQDSQTALKKIRTAGSVSISPELFEKLYLSPQTNVRGDLRKTVGNPTPIALIGFLLSITPLSMDLMGWRGATGSGASGTGMYFFFGGLLMTLGAIGEWILGNTFPFVVFGSFGGFWLGFGATLQPFYNAYGAYSTNPDVPAEGLASGGFRAGLAFTFISMSLMCFIYLLCSLRTNVTFFLIFLSLALGFAVLSASYLQLNNENVILAGQLQIAAGAFFFAACVFGWWIFIAIMLASLDFPFSLPVGDLSTVIKGASERNKDV